MSKTLTQFLNEHNYKLIANHKAVESYENNHGEKFVNLKPGYHWDGQRSFGAETHKEIYGLLKQVKKETD